MREFPARKRRETENLLGASLRQPLLNCLMLSNDLLTVYKVAREFESSSLQRGGTNSRFASHLRSSPQPVMNAVGLHAG